MNTPDELSDALSDAEARVAALEAFHEPRARAIDQARTLVTEVVKRRNRVQQRGVPMWEGAQRAALRMVVLAAGCVALITGATALDSTLGGASIVVTLGVLAVEGMR